MSRFLGQFKENTGLFVVSSEDGNTIHISCSKRVLAESDMANLGAVADAVMKSAQSFVVDIEKFQVGYRKLVSVSSPSGSVYKLSELLRRSYNQRDEVILEKLARVIESLVRNKQLTSLLADIVYTADDYEIDFGIRYR